MLFLEQDLGHGRNTNITVCFFYGLVEFVPTLPNWASTLSLVAFKAPPLKTPLVLPALYGFLKLTDNITNYFLAKFRKNTFLTQILGFIGSMFCPFLIAKGT